jgi:adenylyl-sulfate kinase
MTVPPIPVRPVEEIETKAIREGLLGHRAAILWLTGLSGSGKSTLATGLERRLLEQRLLTVVVDGDVLRSGLNQNLGFTPGDRRENIRRAAEVALYLADAGAIVVVALISPLRINRAAAAERIRASGVPFAEVFVNAPLATCEQRDPKGLYHKARAGEIKSFTGIDAPYEPPLTPTLELRTDLESIDESLEKLTQLALKLAGHMPAAIERRG